ncbi:MAG TPA: BrxA/BrxB family bacilliredoxin [Chitinophaga sp.]|uniref:BrxA/BrxB family bacilliredoxin n=1 Tax=Chitinophaga sp. TaxID=1869181 RepID=UPI002CE4AF1C|nr:BrxA/BrxB family bacilliredoxin [Chitinophaga sp.]HVI47147.1 BrxA/BrxB family bacilliredoxin [Chitinophaga sp.]
MKDELTEVGFKDLVTAEEVEKVMNNTSGTTLIAINSVCGCAAGMARPGARLALDNEKKPTNLVAVFAGQDLEATARMRAYFADVPPSSPSFAFFKDGELVYFIPRHRIEGRDAQAVAADLKACFDEFC